MSAPSMTRREFNRTAQARDTYFSGEQPADDFASAERAPPVCPVSAPSHGVRTSDDLAKQMLQLEFQLSLWRLEFGSLAGFWEAHPESLPTALAAGLGEAQSAQPAAPIPQPVTDQDYISQVALELFGNQAA